MPRWSDTAFPSTRMCAKLGRGNARRSKSSSAHASIQTTEPYLGTRQDFAQAPNDRFGLRLQLPNVRYVPYQKQNELSSTPSHIFNTAR
jgi:hypothetical protein